MVQRQSPIKDTSMLTYKGNEWVESHKRFIPSNPGDINMFASFDRKHLQLHRFTIQLVPLFVDFIHRQLHAVEHVLAQRRQIARQRLGHTDFDNRRRTLAAREQHAQHQGTGP